jgi:hypothetical protein
VVQRPVEYKTSDAIRSRGSSSSSRPAAEKLRQIPDAADKHHEEHQALHQHLKQIKDKERKTKGEWSAEPQRMETVTSDRLGVESRDGGDSGTYLHYESAEEVLLTSGYHSHPTVQQPPSGKPLYDFTIGKPAKATSLDWKSQCLADPSVPLYTSAC